MNQETISLVLRHADISTTTTADTASNSCGFWTNGKQSTTWNVNLRNLMGDTFDKYDVFVLRLNQTAFSSANFPSVANTDNLLLIQLSGLVFVNSSYNVALGNNSSVYPMVLTNIPTSTAVINNYCPNVSLCNFRKSGDNVQITIELIRMIDNTPAVYGLEKFPHGAYSFDIYPVKK